MSEGRSRVPQKCLSDRECCVCPIVSAHFLRAELTATQAAWQVVQGGEPAAVVAGDCAGVCACGSGPHSGQTQAKVTERGSYFIKALEVSFKAMSECVFQQKIWLLFPERFFHAKHCAKNPMQLAHSIPSTVIF